MLPAGFSLFLQAAALAVIKRVPDALQQQPDVLDGPVAQVRVPLARIAAAVAGRDDAGTRWRENIAGVEAALAAGDAREALARGARLGEGPAVAQLQAALRKCEQTNNAEAALAAARRQLRRVELTSPEAVTDADGSLDAARALWASETARVRRGLPAAGAKEAARRLIAGTRANYKRQNVEGFDLSALEAAARAAKARAPRSLADVLADIRAARLAREKARAAAAAPPVEAVKPSSGKGGAFGVMQDEIDANLKRMVVGSSLDFDSEKTVQLIRSIGGDFSNIGQYAAEKKADAMIEAGKVASKRITELVDEVSALAKQCPDQRAASELLRAAAVLKDFAVRTKLFTSIKAASLNNKASDESMQTFSKELGGAVIGVIRLFYTARIKIYEKDKK